MKLEYKHDEYERVDWRAMIPKEFKYPNSDWFYKTGKEIPESTDGLCEDAMVIRMGGLKWAAEAYGFKSVKNKLVERYESGAVASCTIKWKDGTSYTDIASANTENTRGIIGERFFEVIAANRAFCRVVRNSLGINSVSDQELDPADVRHGKEEEEKTPPKTTPHGILENLAIEKGYKTLDDLIKGAKPLGYFHKKMEDWVEYKNLPVKECRTLIGKLKSIKD